MTVDALEEGAPGSRTSTRAPSPARATSPRRPRRRGLRGLRPRSGAGSGSSRRAATACGPRTRTSTPSAVRRRDDHRRRAAGVHRGRDPAGAQAARANARAFGTRCTPEHPLGRADGLVRGRLRGLLPLREGLMAERTSASAAARPGAALASASCPVPTSATRDDPHGPRRRRPADAAAHREHLRPALRQPGSSRAARRRRPRRPAARASRSRPTRSWSARSSSRAATSARSPCTAPSTTWRCAARAPRALGRAHPRGGLRDGGPLADRPVDAARGLAARGVVDRDGRHEGRRPGQGGRRLRQHDGRRASSRRHRDLAPARARRATSSSSAARSPSTASRSCRSAKGSGSRRRSRATRRRCTASSRISSRPRASAVHVLRDPTRGGVASDAQRDRRAGRRRHPPRGASIPVAEEVRGACEILGLDPLYVANEGKLPRDRRTGGGRRGARGPPRASARREGRSDRRGRR